MILFIVWDGVYRNDGIYCYNIFFDTLIYDVTVILYWLKCLNVFGGSIMMGNSVKGDVECDGLLFDWCLL